MSNCHRHHDSSLLKNLTKNEDIYTHYENCGDNVTWWCSGCGNYGIQKALIRALTLEKLRHTDVLLCFDIGCNGNGSDKIGGYTIHGLHGRVLPLAAGAKIANEKMKVIAMAGDGATFSEGVNHLVHAVRNNYPITFILHNNENYALTTGQPSSMTRQGHPMNSAPDGAPLEPMNAARFVLSLNPTFVARSFSGDVEHITKMIQKGINHPGFSFVEIMQVCPTYNKATSQEWFWERIKHVEEMKDYDKTDIWTARRVAEDLENEIAMGVLYETDSPHFLERLPQRQGVKTALTEEVEHVDVSKLLETFV